MAWTSGVLGKFKTVENVGRVLKDFKSERVEFNQDLKNIIQLDSIITTLKDGVEVYSGVVVDEYLRTTKRIVEDEQGFFKITEGESARDLRYGRFWLTAESIVICDSSYNTEFVFRVISEALGGGENSIRPVSVDIERIARDYRGHWLGSIVDREGNMRSGTFFGNDLEDDDVIGEEYKRSHKNQVGIVTHYFQAPTKVRITRHGVIMVLSDVGRENYIQFIRDELLGYAQEIVEIRED